MESKVVLITGASSGIGAEAARHLSKVGYKSLALVARRGEQLRRVADECKAAGAKDVIVLPFDLSIVGNGAAAVTKTVEHFGRLDICVLSAGISPPNALGNLRDDHVEVEGVQLVMQVNFMSQVAITKAALPHLERTKGNILFVSSVLGSTAFAGGAAYCASKAALNHFARCVALEEASKGIRINTISPGTVMTPLLYAFADPSMGGKPSVDNKELADKVRANDKAVGMNHMGRIGETVEIARLIAFLVSDENSYMTGSDIVADGGWNAGAQWN